MLAQGTHDEGSRSGMAIDAPCFIWCRIRRVLSAARVYAVVHDDASTIIYSYTCLAVRLSVSIVRLIAIARTRPTVPRRPDKPAGEHEGPIQRRVQENALECAGDG